MHPQPNHSSRLSLPPPSTDSIPPSPPPWQRLLSIIGLPCLISVAAIDPGNLEVDLQSGMNLRYTLIWSLLIASVIGFVLQTLCAQLTILTDLHLSQLCRRAYRRNPFLVYVIFAFSELSVIAFDVAEVVGTAFALQLLFGWPLWLGMVLSALDTLFVLYLQRNGLTSVEIIIEGMLLLLAGCLFYEFALSNPDPGSMLIGALVPSLGQDPREGALLAIGILGSVLMSHNLFLHSWLIRERHHVPYEGQSGSESTSWGRGGALRYAAVEAAVIFAATFAVNAAVLSVSASLPEEVREGEGEIGLKDAGILLKNVLGTEWASMAWGLALLASGHAATVTGSLASQAVCEGFMGIGEARNGWGGVVLLTRAVAIVPALIAGLLAGEGGADRLVVLSQVVLSLALPFAVIPLFKIWRALEMAGVMFWMGLGMFVAVCVANGLALMGIWKDILGGAGLGTAVVAAGMLMSCIALMGWLAWEEVDLAEDVPMRKSDHQGEAEGLLRSRVNVYS
eukprot:GFKZ01010242.1.p1 GENE.GFKZ01010242.1~~GFKZ01010242.1.p1  ORF type:complete len:508 (+),score=49.89 GFKZ01010242.1:558-2081(+)